MIKEKTLLSVGIAQVNITPQPGLRTAGMPNPPRTEGILFPLYGRLLVFDDGQQCSAVISIDNLGLEPSLIPDLRVSCSQGTRLPPENIMIACTHTHSAPYSAAVLQEGEIDYGYFDFLRDRLVMGMHTAFTTRQPARIRIGKIDAPGWTFNRRQVYGSERYGEQVGTQGPQTVPGFLHNEGPEDNQLQVLLAETLDGHAIGGMINFACHPTLTYQKGKNYSADFPGALTAKLSEKYNCPFAFLQGAAGNLWGINTAIKEDGQETNLFYIEEMAKDLSAKAVEALVQGTYLKCEPVRMTKKMLSISQRRPTRAQLDLARWYLEKAPETIDEQEFTRQIYEHDYTFYSNDPIIQEWLAREIISLWEWQRRIGRRNLTEQVEIQVITIGDLALVGFPVEYFTEFGLRIKAESPFPNTFIVELANGWHGYIPTQAAFDHGGYEPRLAYTSRLAPEAGDLMYEAALDLLTK